MRRIGDWELDAAPLGSGSFSIVYRAKVRRCRLVYME